MLSNGAEDHMVIILTSKTRKWSRQKGQHATLPRKVAEQPRFPRHQEEAWSNKKYIYSNFFMLFLYSKDHTRGALPKCLFVTFVGRTGIIKCFNCVFIDKFWKVEFLKLFEGLKQNHSKFQGGQLTPLTPPVDTHVTLPYILNCVLFFNITLKTATLFHRNPTSKVSQIWPLKSKRSLSWLTKRPASLWNRKHSHTRKKKILKSSKR
jgi:hypothetical protein